MLPRLTNICSRHMSSYAQSFQTPISLNLPTLALKPSSSLPSLNDDQYIDFLEYDEEKIMWEGAVGEEYSCAPSKKAAAKIQNMLKKQQQMKNRKIEEQGGQTALAKEADKKKGGGKNKK